MPWTAADAVKHNKHATGALGVRWAKVANAVLRKSGDEGKAIRVASGVIKHHRKRAARKAKAS